jgi:hypothetical protein
MYMIVPEEAFSCHHCSPAWDSFYSLLLQVLLVEKKMYYRIISGNWYAYKSVREGDTVRTIYLGKA